MSTDNNKRGNGRVARQIVTAIQKSRDGLRKMHSQRALTRRESKKERKFVTDILRRGKERLAKAKAAPGYDPNVLPPTSKLRKVIEERKKDGNTLFDRMLARPLAEGDRLTSRQAWQAWQEEQNKVDRARVAAGEVSEEFLAEWYKRQKRPTRGAAGRKAAAQKKTTSKRSEERQNEIIALHKQGRGGAAGEKLLDRDIAKKLGLSVKTIERALKEHRIR